MDLNYNMRYLQDYLTTLFKYVLKERGSDALKSLLTDLINNNESKLLNKKIQEELNKYSPKTIKLILEKNVLLSLEHSVFNINKSYWAALKDRYPNISTNFIILYFDKYIDFLENPTNYHTKYMDDLTNTFDNEIKESMRLNTSFEDAINKVSYINLDHMKNLNANGRTISVGENRKGGIFLTRESNIGYGKFINKQEFLNNIKSISNSHRVIAKKGKISNEELENIVNQIGQTISISDNEKNKNSKIITDVQANRKAGNIFTGNNGFDLPNGEYVSVEEMTLAINKYIKERDKKEKSLNVVKRKGIFKKVMAASLLAISLLTTKVSAFNDENIKTTVTQYELDDLTQMNNSSNIDIVAKDTVQKTESDNENITLVTDDKINEETSLNPNNSINESTILDLNTMDNNSQVVQEHIEVEKTETVVEQEINNDFETIDSDEIEEDNDSQNIDSDEIEVSTLIEEESVIENYNVEDKNPYESIEENEMVSEEIIINTEEEKENQLIEELNSGEQINQSIEENNSNTDNSIEEEITNEEKIESEDKQVTIEEIEELNKEITSDIPNDQIISETSSDLVDVASHVTESTNEEILTEAEPVTSQEVVDYALQFVGNPYVYGGNSLTEGVDCSGFTKNIYSNFGIEIPRTSSEQRNVGNNIGVDLENAMPGDLLCFNGHVGIYIGDGQMVHAANEKSGIKINDVDYDKNKSLKAIIRFDNIGQVEKVEKTR